MIITILAILLSYLLGSVSTAVIVCQLLGLPDPRTQGSQNPGATNVLRIGGRRAAFWVLLGDFLKGLLPVLIAKLFIHQPPILGLVALAAFLGHLYPLFFQFKGGKGVATAMGAWLGLALSLGGIAILTWVILAGLFRYSSLAAVITAIMVPIYSVWLLGPAYIGPLLILSALLLYRHRDNIYRLIQGLEPKIGKKSP